MTKATLEHANDLIKRIDSSPKIKNNIFDKQTKELEQSFKNL